MITTALDPLLGPIDGGTGIVLVIVLAAVAALSAAPWPVLFLLGFGSLSAGSALAVVVDPLSFTLGEAIVETVENAVFAGLATGLGVLPSLPSPGARVSSSWLWNGPASVGSSMTNGIESPASSTM